jgi:glycogen operon protein
MMTSTASLDVKTCLPGKPWPLGASLITCDGLSGMNLAVFSCHATAVYCCLYDKADQLETARLRLPVQTDGVWHGFLPGIEAGQLYGLRAQGPFEPAAGHRFNPAKLLIDPYARALVGDKRLLSLECGSVFNDSGQEAADPHDNASRVPKACVIDLAKELEAGRQITPGPGIALDKTILYEAHVKGLTRLHPDIPEPLRGTYAALASAPMLAHYKRLGITTLCLLPVHLHIDERHLLALGLTNYWGYNTLGFFMPEPGYASSPETVRDEFRAMVDQLHSHGLEVVLDVVYNHTAEADTKGPTLSWRGLDNASSYARDGAGHDLNPTGCGNALNMGEPHNVQWVMDSLRWWAQAFGVDGFRFDLATTLARDPQLHHSFHPGAALLTAIAQDPLLSRLKRIAEPWDIGVGGYQVGQFPSGWQEWNDQFRDITRSYWLGHQCTRGEMARTLTASSDLFGHHGRSPLASINMITAHDGFNLADLTAYRHRRNEANGEHNRDGHSHNFSANAGVEGPSDDPTVEQQRARWRRALLSTLMLAQGTPQLLAGDEIGHSQLGNNNAYCQDNPTTWLDWTRADEAMMSFVAGLTGLRRRYPALRHTRWFHGQPTHERKLGYRAGCDIAWLGPNGQPLTDEAWEDSAQSSFACVIEVAEVPDKHAQASERVMLLFNAGLHVLPFVLPPGPWRLALDSAAAQVDAGPLTPAGPTISGVCDLSATTLRLLVQAIDSDPAGNCAAASISAADFQQAAP